MRFYAMIFGALLMLQLSPTHAAKLTGKIVVSKEFREALGKGESEEGGGVQGYYWQLPNGILPVLPPAVDPEKDIAVVLLRKGDDKSQPDEVGKYKVHTGGMERKAIVTRPGSTLEFINESPFTHELYSPQLASFKPEAQSTKSPRRIEFPEAGIFEVRCKLMPNFLSYVVVTPGVDLAVKDDGTIARELDKGDYVLKVFHGGKWVYKHSFSVDGGRLEPLQVKLTAPEAVADDSEGGKGKEGKNNEKSEKKPEPEK